jgi:hypothetical protein
VKPLGTGPLLRLDIDKTKPLELTVRLKPYAGYSAREDTGMLLVVFADEQRILQTRPFNGAGGSVKAAPKTASHVVVIPLNLHGIREFPMTVEWRGGEESQPVYVRGPMQVVQQNSSPDSLWTIAAKETSAVMTHVNPKTGKKESIAFAWDMPPSRLRRNEQVSINFTGAYQAAPPARPPAAVSLPGDSAGAIGDWWTASAYLFASRHPLNAAVQPAQVQAYLKTRGNFRSQTTITHRESRDAITNRERSFSREIAFHTRDPGFESRRYSLRLSVEDDKPVTRIGFFFTSDFVHYSAAVFWDYAPEQPREDNANRLTTSRP